MTSATKQPYPLHGYQPVVVDEQILSREDRLEAFQELLRCNLWGQAEDEESWTNYLTPDELAAVQPECQGELLDGNDAETQNCRRAEMQRVGHYRQYARKLYGDGRRIWYADGMPPWMPGGFNPPASQGVAGSV